jgi:hypothetical protein
MRVSALPPSGSGGRGKYSAGSGTMRTIRFLERMDCAILSSHRTIRPHGLFGGEPGELGATFVRRNDGRLEELQGADQTVLEPGEAVIVKTPTGGGYGPHDQSRQTRHPPSVAELLGRAREQITELTESLQQVVDPATISAQAKIPFKLLCFREALLWRTEELARTALFCLEQKELAAGGLLARAVTESAAAVWYLRKLMEQHIEQPLSSQSSMQKQWLSSWGTDSSRQLTEGRLWQSIFSQ